MVTIGHGRIRERDHLGYFRKTGFDWLVSVSVRSQYLGSWKEYFWEEKEPLAQSSLVLWDYSEDKVKECRRHLDARWEADDLRLAQGKQGLSLELDAPWCFRG